jgi:hypothetical protein
MSILDFTTGLFREPANLRSFVDDPDQALKDAGLPDATPDQVHDLLPVVAASMPKTSPPIRSMLATGAWSRRATRASANRWHRRSKRPDDGGLDLDISGVVWGEAVE